MDARRGQPQLALGHAGGAAGPVQAERQLGGQPRASGLQRQRAAERHLARPERQRQRQAQWPVHFAQLQTPRHRQARQRCRRSGQVGREVAAGERQPAGAQGQVELAGAGQPLAERRPGEVGAAQAEVALAGQAGELTGGTGRQVEGGIELGLELAASQWTQLGVGAGQGEVCAAVAEGQGSVYWDAQLAGGRRKIQHALAHHKRRRARQKRQERAGCRIICVAQPRQRQPLLIEPPDQLGARQGQAEEPALPERLPVIARLQPAQALHRRLAECQVGQQQPLAADRQLAPGERPIAGLRQAEAQQRRGGQDKDQAQPDQHGDRQRAAAEEGPGRLPHAIPGAARRLLP